MASLRDTIRLALEGDSAYMLISTGGVVDMSETDREGLSLSDVPKQADGVRIKTISALRFRGSNPTDQSDTIIGIEHRFFNLWVYSDQGYTDIDNALRRAKALFDLKYFTADNEGIVYLRWAGDLSDFNEDALGGAAAGSSRYQIILVRK